MNRRTVQMNFMNMMRQQQRYRPAAKPERLPVNNFRARSLDDEAKLRKVMVVQPVISHHLLLDDKNRQPAFAKLIV
ncbi:hypothetical protein D3C73_1601530 [compost metagenome]